MNFSKAHFIGIAGKGMSATALLLRQMGVQITGSDEGFYPPVSDYLKNEKIQFAEGYRKENIPGDADVIVIGKNAKLQPESNEEVRAAMDSGKLVRSFADLLHDMTANSDTIVAAGSYGKSTCTALLAWCLRVANKDPSYFIGEITNGFERHAHRGQGSTFVLEGDEYPASNWDGRSKFLRYNAKNVLLTSATHDHINVFPTHADYLSPFRSLLGSLPSDGLLVVSSSELEAILSNVIGADSRLTISVHCSITSRSLSARKQSATSRKYTGSRSWMRTNSRPDSSFARVMFSNCNVVEVLPSAWITLRAGSQT